MSMIARLPQLVAVVLMLSFVAACTGSRTRESAGEYIDDSVITNTVKARLLADKDVSGLAINVDTFKAVVQLSGFVKTEAERRKAAQLAGSVRGVKNVKNEIQLK